MKTVAILVGLFGALLISAVDGAGSFKWSKSYTLKATLTVPAANLSEPYQVWLDGDTGKARVDFYDGMDKLYRQWDEDKQSYRYFKIYPVTTRKFENKEVCKEMSASSSEIKMYALNSYLPIKRWTYVRPEIINSVEAKKFVYEYRVENVNAKVSYAVWVILKNKTVAVPIRYIYELSSGNKILDYFRHDYSYFDENKPEQSILQKPLGIQCVAGMLISNTHIPIDPVAEYIEPTLEHSRVVKAFDRFKYDFNKKYIDENEYLKRLNTFKHNLRFINSFNRQHNSYTVGVNTLADLTDDELSNLVRTFTPPDIYHEDESEFDDDYNEIDDFSSEKANFDWRSYGAVTSVKDQTALCGSCYAFTAAAAVESSSFIARGCKHLEELSEQAIIDCSGGFNFGCLGGTLENTLKWIKESGVPLRNEYGPYLAIEGFCHLRNMTKLITIQEFSKVEKKKQLIMKTLRENGPLLGAVDSKPKSFFYYSGGIYKDKVCSSDPQEVSHGVTLIGYGKEDTDEYWIIKNSFGSSWGEDGYMRLSTVSNVCGIKNHLYAVKFKKNSSNLCVRKE